MEQFKKYIKIILVAFLFLSSPIGVKANGQEEILQLINKFEKENEKGSFKEFIYRQGYEEFIVQVYEDEIIICDSNGEIVFSALYSFIKQKEYVFEKETANKSAISTLALIDIYDSPENWRGWRAVSDILQFTPQMPDGTISASILGTAMTAVFATAGVTLASFTISVVCGVIASTLVAGETVYVSGEVNYNYNCDIFRLERVKRYDELGNLLYTGPINSNWFQTPWDYTSPAACRILAEKYY